MTWQTHAPIILGVIKLRVLKITMQNEKLNEKQSMIEIKKTKSRNKP